ncbi:MAG: aldehyde dehydrogenase family protein [Micropepsaceae bacterium]
MLHYPDLQLYIAGEWRKTADAIAVVNPADEKEIGRLPCASRADLDDALSAAEEGFRVWSRTAPRDRADIMIAAARLMRERIDEIAAAIALEHGKP